MRGKNEMKRVRAESTVECVIVETNDLRVEWFRERDYYEERILVRTQSGWKLLTNAINERPVTAEDVCSPPITQVGITEQTQERVVVRLTAVAHIHDFHVDVT